MRFTNNIPKSPDNVYLNIDIFNSVRDNNKAIIAEYKENRVKSILPNPQDYYLTIVRFFIPSQQIPIFVFDIEEGINQTDINLGIYSFTFSFSGSNFVQPLIYIRDNFSIPLPKPPSENNGKQDNSLGYYDVFNYQIMVNMMNTSLQVLLLALKTSFPAAPVTEAPFIIYNAETQLFSFILNREWLTAGVEIFFNTFLSRYLEAIPLDFFGFDAPFGKIARLKIQFTGNNAFLLVVPGAPIPTTPEHIQLEQEYVVIQYWNSFKKIIIKSDLLPVNPEFLSSDNDSNAFERILTDFEPIAHHSGDARSIEQFFPSGPYRLIDMQSSNPIQALDIAIFWADNEGFLRPLFIDPGTSISVKILFIKKDLFKNSLMFQN